MDIITYILSKNFAKKYTDEQILKIGKGMEYKGSVLIKDNLPLENNAKGFVYTVINENGQEYIWTSDLSSGTFENWELLGGVNLSNFYTKSEIDEKFEELKDGEINDIKEDIEDLKLQTIKINGGEVE